MKISKHALVTAVTGLFISFSSVAHAEAASLSKSIDSSDLSSNFPLVLFAMAGIVVYLCNRPRVTVCARARRRTEVSRN
jgi:hypothetical protein